jgi:hypothetical protein
MTVKALISLVVRSSLFSRKREKRSQPMTRLVRRLESLEHFKTENAEQLSCSSSDAHVTA